MVGTTGAQGSGMTNTSPTPSDLVAASLRALAAAPRTTTEAVLILSMASDMPEGVRDDLPLGDMDDPALTQAAVILSEEKARLGGGGGWWQDPHKWAMCVTLGDIRRLAQTPAADLGDDDVAAALMALSRQLVGARALVLYILAMMPRDTRWGRRLDTLLAKAELNAAEREAFALADQLLMHECDD